MKKINRYWNSYPDSLVEPKRPQTYDLCKSCECINQLLWKEKRLKRALWIARAERAREKALIFYFAMTESYNLNINGYSSKEKGHIRMRPARWWRIKWLKVEHKCRAKAEEYK